MIIYVMIALAAALLAVITFILGQNMGQHEALKLVEDPSGVIFIDTTTNGETLRIELHRTLPDLQKCKYVIFEIQTNNSSQEKPLA